MFTGKWRVVHQKSRTDFTVLNRSYWTKRNAQRDAKALNESRDTSFIAELNRAITGNDVYIVRTVREIVAMELERARLVELKLHEKAEAAERLRRTARSGRLSDGTPAVELHIQAQAFPIPQEPWRGRRGRPIERERDESSADGGFGVCREPRPPAPADEHPVGHRLPGDVPTQGAAGADQQCDGQPSAGDAGSSDCGSSGSYGTD